MTGRGLCSVCLPGCRRVVPLRLGDGGGDGGISPLFFVLFSYPCPFARRVRTHSLPIAFACGRQIAVNKIRKRQPYDTMHKAGVWRDEANKRLVVSFRGTAELEDILTDVNFLQVRVESSQCLAASAGRCRRGGRVESASRDVFFPQSCSLVQGRRA